MAAAHPFGSFVGCRFKRIGIARLQETTSKCALTLCHAVLRVLRLLALVGPALRPPASQCAPGLKGDSWGEVCADGRCVFIVQKLMEYSIGLGQPAGSRPQYETSNFPTLSSIIHRLRMCGAPPPLPCTISWLTRLMPVHYLLDSHNLRFECCMSHSPLSIWHLSYIQIFIYLS